jgi:signal transduction histidine kinase
MQQTEPTPGWGGAERRRVEAVVESLATARGEGESLAELAHDARNMVTALGLYCDLLEEPGVLATPYAHYGNELRLVAAASRRLVEKLVALDTQANPNAWANPGAQASPDVLGGRDAPLRVGLMDPGKPAVKTVSEGRQAHRWDLMPAVAIESLAGELLANRNLLAALAGPGIALTVDTEGGALGVRLTGEDLTRVLVNLVKNAAEAMPAGGKILLRLRERPAETGAAKSLSLTIEDSGAGISPKALDKIFEAGFTTQSTSLSEAGWAATHRGLGLSITRSIIEAAGGRIQAANRDPAGARLEIELPVRTR